MKHIDLFTGILGFSLAAEWVWGDEYELVLCCESDPFCQKVIRKHRPNVPIVEDVRDVRQILAYAQSRESRKQTKQEGREDISRGSQEITPVDIFNLPNVTTNVDLLTGGFPCQGFSVAGKQRGKEDERYLWPAMLEVVKATRPRWVIGENVNGIINLALDTVLSDLEGEGYTTRVFVLPACSQNAPHRRDRVWIVAHSGSSPDRTKDVADTESGNVSRVLSLKGEQSGSGTKRTTDRGHCSSKFGNYGTVESELGLQTDGLPGFLARCGGLNENEKCNIQTVSKGRSSDGEVRALRDIGCEVESTPSRLLSTKSGDNSMHKMPRRGTSENGNMGAREQNPQDLSDMQEDLYPESFKEAQDLQQGMPERNRETKRQQTMAWKDFFQRAWGAGEWEEGIPRVAVGVKDRVNKLKALGNAIVPQIVIPIMQAIKAIEEI